MERNNHEKGLIPGETLMLVGSYFERLPCQAKAIHEITRSGRALFVLFRVISWIVLIPAEESTKPKLGHHPDADCFDHRIVNNAQFYC